MPCTVATIDVREPMVFRTRRVAFAAVRALYPDAEITVLWHGMWSAAVAGVQVATMHLVS